jgi:hypothetical protein
LRIFVSDINFSPAVAVTHIDAPPLSAELFWGKQAISSLNLGISATFAEKDLGISAIFAKKTYMTDRKNRTHSSELDDVSGFDFTRSPAC